MGYEIFQVFEGFILILLLLFLVYEIIKNGIKINLYNISYYVFNLFFILPELVTLFCGPTTLGYSGYRLVLGDIWIDIIWLFIIIIIDFTLLLWVKTKSRKGNNNSINLSGIRNIKIPKWVRFVSYILICLPTVAAILSPQPSLYFSSFAAFYRKDVFGVTSEAVAWHNDVMNTAIFVAVVGLIALWIESQRKKTFFRCVLYLISFEILWFSNKRTLGIMIIILMLMIDILYSKKIPWFKIVIIITGCIAYFVVYQNIAKASHVSVEGSFNNIYHLYFDRVIDMKLVICSLIYPEKVQILDYWGQSFLFDILFFIPRSLWENKPYPFAMYYSAALKLGSLESVNGRFLTSFFAEIICNFSWFGIPIGLFLYRKIIDFIEQIKNPLVYLFGVYSGIYLLITQIGSNHENFVLLILLYAILEKKKHIRLKSWK